MKTREPSAERGTAPGFRRYPERVPVTQRLIHGSATRADRIEDSMFAALLRGAAAGAAGTTALNAATYVDMAVRARPSSSTPQQTVETLAERSGHPIPGEGAEKQNRITGLGSLGGIATGIAIGTVAGFFGPITRRLPLGLATVLFGGAAMALTGTSMKRLGITDPTAWSVDDWASDALPHLAYGAVTAATLRAMAH